MKIVAICNSKGGVSKTTCAINIGAGLTKQKYKVLLIDLDPHAHLTDAVGIKKDSLTNTVYEILTANIDPHLALIKRNCFDLIPSRISLCQADQMLSSTPGGECVLREALDKIKEEYDYIFIDCPPSLNHLTLNALTAAQEVLVPLQTQYMAMRGMEDLMQTIEIVKKRLNPEVAVTGIIATFCTRSILNREVINMVKKHFGDTVFRTVIRQNIALAEAPSHGKTIFEYAPQSNGAKDFQSLCEEIIERTNTHGSRENTKTRKHR